MAVLGYVDGKAAYLRFKQKYSEIPIKKINLRKVVNQKEIKLSVEVKKNYIYAYAADRKTRTDKIRSTKGYVGLYSNSRALFSKFRLTGTLDEDWVKEISKNVQRNSKQYLQIARKRGN